MSIEQLKEAVMQQAQEKGFGTKPEEIVVAEKIALIHSEISEAYDAYLKNNREGKDGFYEELGDVLQRTLHLGGIYGVIFASGEIDFRDISSSELEGKIAKLHKATSEAYENYRHQRLEPFKEKLIYLGFATIQVAQDYCFSLEQAALNKIEKNKDRKWDKARMNEHFS